ncbi:ankyrin repeat and SOCS box protein 3-like isoform X2 [Limulus polyphemus]|uniref:Ankyrin repeat and SOCS box protein 3-like isoform X2 n=1 Tax=Limulus polyphemus TaxID=6850 RepID=A0ABM1TMR9_LIMPO|nr:ankyrin repeat and SOCS box protein 3-like isoform X2 [Limulus polyphemus]
MRRNLKTKSDVNWQTHEGETALLLACKRRHGEDAATAVRMLLRYGANVNISDNEEETPLLAACRAGSTLVVKLLVDTGQANVNVGDCSGWHPLHEAATTGNLDMVQILLAANSMLDVQDECRMTPIFTAAQHGRYQCLKILLDAMKERGQERLINRGAEDWATPLMIAAQQGFTDCVELLQSYGANPNLRTVDNVTALHLAVQGNHVESVKLLLEHMDIGQVIKLCQRQDVGVLQQAEEEATTDYVVSPLHLAIEWQSYGCLELLLTSGFPADGLLERSDLTLETLHGGLFLYETALTFAASKGDVEGMNILLEAGASCEATLENILPPLVPGKEYILHKISAVSHEFYTFSKPHYRVSHSMSFPHQLPSLNGAYLGFAIAPAPPPHECGILPTVCRKVGILF